MTPTYEYILYVDEAGDVGTRTAAEGDKGSTEWFALGGFVVARRYESEVAEWVRQIRQDAGAPPDAVQLHFNGLDRQRRIAAAESVAKLPI